jgi:hypothetical protein
MTETRLQRWDLLDLAVVTLPFLRPLRFLRLVALVRAPPAPPPGLSMITTDVPQRN